MERSLLARGACAALGAAAVAAGCGATRTVTTTVRSAPTPGADRETILFGHIASLRRSGARFELRFDPAWLLTGTAAERAAVEDGTLAPGDPVPNDVYTVEEGHRLLRFDVRPDASATLLDKRLRPVLVTVAELAAILSGTDAVHRPLFDPSRRSGFWIRVGANYPNPVVSLDQQYHP